MCFKFDFVGRVKHAGNSCYAYTRTHCNVIIVVFLAVSIMTGDGIRDVNFPAGKWVDFWNGEILEDYRWIKKLKMPLEPMPVYAKFGVQVPIYPYRVQCSDETERLATHLVVCLSRFRHQFRLHSLFGGSKAPFL